MNKTILLFAGLSIFTFSFNIQAQTVNDYDGNAYNTVTIGKQKWMKENLKVIHYNNGDAITNVTDSLSWINLKTGAYCNYRNNIANTTIYGRLYNWYAAKDSRKICPVSWHIPSKAEYTTMETYLGGSSLAGSKMKEVGTSHWYNPNSDANNSSGFTGLPGGNRNNTGAFNYVIFFGSWWVLTESDALNAWYFGLSYNGSTSAINTGQKSRGYSIRCIKDSTADINNFYHQDDLQIYPNPAIDVITIDFSKIQSAEMYIYNIVGTCVLQKKLNASVNEIDIRSLSKGIYVLKLSGSDWTTQRKFIKE